MVMKKETVCTNDISIVYYEDFGAVGDGVTNDYEAIYNAHVKANECGRTVMATKGKTYYLESPIVNGTPKSIPVKTNVDWNGAKFIIDDRKIHETEETSKWNVAVFKVEQDQESITYTSSDTAQKSFLDKIIAKGLNKNTTNIDLGDEYKCPVMIITENETHKIYRRRGYGGYQGKAMQEVIILDKDGNVREDTPVMYDYIDLTGLQIFKLDEVKPITIKNGEFTTRAAQVNCITEDTYGSGIREHEARYTARSIHITRSFTTLENVKHYMSDEKPYSECYDSDCRITYVPPRYRGFYSVINCTDVTLKNCVLTSKRAYRRPDGGTGGTYELSVRLTNNLVLDGCVTSNFWVALDENYNVKVAKEGDPGVYSSNMNLFPHKLHCDNGRWLGSRMFYGTTQTNLSKNTKYLNSTIPRYDAHEGTYGGEIRNCTVSTVALTGAGDFYIENTRIFHEIGENVAISLRADYGCTWDGTIHVKDVSVINPVTDPDALYVTAPKYDKYNWYWGYFPSMPSLVVENICYYDFNKYDSATKTYKQVPDTVPIYLYGKNVTADYTMHLSKIANEPYYSVEDKDNDGYIDIPDIDADGVWGNTQWKYDEIKERLGRYYPLGFKPSEYGGDIADSDGLYDNFAQVIPPEFVKIPRNESGYKYYICNTATSGISNGLYNGAAENNKGFYGSTKFYYSETEFYQGPPSESEKNSDENYFVFY